MFIPKKSRIFEHLVRQSNIIQEAARTFHRITHDWKQLKEGSDALVKLEYQGDECVHTITDEIEEIFILPLDKEDIKELTDVLDDIVDNLEQTANRLSIYKIPSSNEALRSFSELILETVQHIHRGILMVQEHRFASEEFTACCEKLHELETQGDRLHRGILEELMSQKPPHFNGKDPLFIVKWKEIFQTLEDTLDVCETMAIIFVRLRIKYR